jgi:hypothetical protein
VKLLLDEMYPASLAKGLHAAGLEATIVSALRLAGSADAEIFAAAVAQDLVVLTENVADFTPIAADHTNAPRRQPGLLIALSSRFSWRPSGAEPLIAAAKAVSREELADRVVYLERTADT